MSNHKIGKYILKRLSEEGKTQVSLAEHLGISRQLLNWKIQKDYWLIKDLPKIVAFFGADSCSIIMKLVRK